VILGGAAQGMISILVKLILADALRKLVPETRRKSINMLAASLNNFY
jgi:hypothetical protein